MKLQLQRPLVVFDLETTGLNIATDRIVELSYCKIFPDGSRKGETFRMRPVMTDGYGKEVTMPIPKEASAVHGIYDEDVSQCPTFKERAEQIVDIFADADLAGYNSSRFDVPLLAEECLRAGVKINFFGKHLVDAYTIFQQHEPHTLTAAYKFYCGKSLTDAHTAYADTMATYEVLMAQLERYDDMPDNIEALSKQVQGEHRFADLAGRIAYDPQGREVFTFGKYKGQCVLDVFRRDSGYYNWLLDSDFPQYTKQIFTRIYLDRKK